jgi:hypothetical protein
LLGGAGGGGGGGGGGGFGSSGGWSSFTGIQYAIGISSRRNIKTTPLYASYIGDTSKKYLLYFMSVAKNR